MGSSLCIGCGDIGRRVAKLYINDGHSFEGWVKSEPSYQLGKQSGIGMHRIDLDATTLPNLSCFSDKQLFWFAPPPVEGETDKRLRQFLSALRSQPKRVLLISTTGVYGDCGGRWIDESEPLKPLTLRAKRRLDAETVLQSYAEMNSVEWVILRVPGIYAKDRLPLARLKRGEPTIEQNKAPWTNRVHADDLAIICKQAMDTAASGSIYNVCDNQPSTMTDYFNQIADYANLPRPPQISQDQAKHVMSPGMLSYLKESRRISNHKMIKELGITLRYPALRDGLKPRDS